MMNDDRQRLIESFRRGPEILKEALGRYPHESWSFKPAQDAWSIREIVVHILDSEVNGYIRCRALVAEPGKTIMAYDQDRWVTELCYEAQDIDDTLALFTLLRTATTRLLSTMPATAWEHTIHHPERGMMTLDDWLQMYESHVPMHLAQMERTYRVWLDVTSSVASKR